MEYVETTKLDFRSLFEGHGILKNSKEHVIPEKKLDTLSVEEVEVVCPQENSFSAIQN